MKLLALAGGVGGAKLADGFYRLDPSHQLTVIVNTGDDFSLFGLYICPDLDTVCYTLAGLENPKTGWGRAEDSWETLTEINELGGPKWFRIGDKDLALNLERTRRLQEGETLTKITRDFCRNWNIDVEVLPMSDQPVPTIVHTEDGDLSFQDYFVKKEWKPKVRGFTFKNVDKALPANGVIQAIQDADLIVICPSNPLVSIDPILAVPGIRDELDKKVVLAVSPLIGGKAVKGPAAKMYRELGLDPTAAIVAEHYGNLLTGFIMDSEDRELAQELSESGLRVFTTDSWMKNRQDRILLAENVLDIGQLLLKEGK